jgi:hypothetical protein
MSHSALRSPCSGVLMNSPVTPSSPTHSSMPPLESPVPSIFHTFAGDPLQLRYDRTVEDPGWPFLIGEPSSWHSESVAVLMKIPQAVSARLRGVNFLIRFACRVPRNATTARCFASAASYQAGDASALLALSPAPTRAVISTATLSFRRCAPSATPSFTAIVCRILFLSLDHCLTTF